MSLDLRDSKGWRDAVHACIKNQARSEFSVQELYELYGELLSARFPGNNFIREGIRRELQKLRDKGYLAQGEERGVWLHLASVFKEEEPFDVRSFIINTRPLPNRPLSEMWEKQQTFEYENSRDHSADVYLGSLGETVVFHNERKKLKAMDRNDLAKKVKQVSQEEGDSAGYDILSFDDRGEEKWIEVKTTKGNIGSRFFISENQISVSERHPNKYWLYRLFDFDFEKQCTSMYSVPGPLRGKLDLRPNKYSALPDTIYRR